MISVVAATGPSWAQAALDEGQPPATPEGEAQPAPTTSDPTTEPTSDGVEDPDKKVHYGVALRLRSVRIPKGLVELFVEHSAGGTSNVGLGVELIRRRGTVEIQLGMEFEHITPGEGPWIKKGDNVAAGSEADFILNPEDAGESLGWFTIEFTFLDHAKINKYVSVRYGGGAGLGILTGGLYRYDVQCVGATNEMPVPGCVPAGMSFEGQQGRGIASGRVKYELPPVMPVVNAILGVQITPMPKLVVNIEGGIRLAPFFGTSVGYFF